MKCSNCKSINIPEEARFCPNCGTRINKQAGMLSYLRQLELPNGRYMSLGESYVDEIEPYLKYDCVEDGGGIAQLNGDCKIEIWWDDKTTLITGFSWDDSISSDIPNTWSNIGINVQETCDKILLSLWKKGWDTVWLRPGSPFFVLFFSCEESNVVVAICFDSQNKLPDSIWLERYEDWEGKNGRERNIITGEYKDLVRLLSPYVC